MRRIGTQMPLTEEESRKLIQELNFWRNFVSRERFYERRSVYENAFLQRWNNQSADGTVRDTNNAAAWPFDGASDQRVRWGDKIYAEFESLVLVALASAQLEIKCPGGADAERRARSLSLLLKWEINKLGANWLAQVRSLLHYCIVDTPAVGVMDVGWRKRVTLGVRTLEAQELADEFTQWMIAVNDGNISVTDAEALYWAILRGEADRPEIARFLIDVKKCRFADIPAIMQALSVDGECEVLAQVDGWEGPSIQALRFGDDFTIPTLADDFEYASPMFRNEWVTEQQLRERVSEDGWSAEWVDEECRHKGCAFYNEMTTTVVEEMKDLINITWCYTAEVNEAGETVRYVSVIGHAKGSAFGKRVIRSRRGKWNMVFFRREVIAGNVLASRGLAMLSSADQGIAKSIRDMAANNALVGSLPPIKAKGARTRNSIIEPFAVLNMGAGDDVAFMQPPAYPAAAKEIEDRIRRELHDFLGVATEGGGDVTTRQRAFVQWMLTQFKDLYVALLETAQDNASDEILAGITGDGDVKGLKREDITGDFGLTLELDPSNLNSEALNAKLATLSQMLLAMDRDGVIDRTPVVTHAFGLLFPELANSSLKTPDQMVGQDLDEEKRNFVLIKAGVMPRMDTEGKWNYGARLQFYQDLQQNNPDAIADMSPRSQEMLQQWMAALQQQQTQFGANAQIGRTGVESVTAQ